MAQLSFMSYTKGIQKIDIDFYNNNKGRCAKYINETATRHSKHFAHGGHFIVFQQQTRVL